MRPHLLRGLGLLGLVFGSALALASPSDEVAECLDAVDLACAHRIGDVLVSSDPRSVVALRVSAWLSFHEGRYDEAVAHIETLKTKGVDLEKEEPDTPYRPTQQAAQGMVERKRGGLSVRHAPGYDAILGEEALDTLTQARVVYARLLGAVPPQGLVLDIFPTASRFTLASGLPEESVETTGVVALSKWSRLLLTSPRALSHGYEWKDTVSHEYIHLVVSWRTQDRAPVWLQEGLAKYLEGFWRGATDGGLSAHHQSLLANAVHTGKFVPFEKFARSMAYLDSGEEAALAFAQVSTMVRFLVETKGEGVLPGVLDEVRSGVDAQQAVARAAGFGNFEEFRAGWVRWLGGLPLIQKQLAALPVVVDGGGDEFASDPLLAGRPDLARYTRLGDLLREAGRPRAAIVEYEKAADPAGPPSPLLLARKATCYEALGDRARALALVDEGVALYPEFTLLQVTRGRLLDAAGRTEEAVAAWSAAHDLNPYDPAVQAALVRGYEAIGDAAAAARHAGYARILATGGARP